MGHKSRGDHAQIEFHLSSLGKGRIQAHHDQYLSYHVAYIGYVGGKYP